MEWFGLEKFVKVRPPIRGKIKIKPEDFKVTEILQDGFDEPPKKRPREISHEFMSEEDTFKLIEKAGDFALDVKNLMKAEKFEDLIDQKLEIGEYEISKRKALYTFIAENWPWLRGSNIVDLMILSPNLKSFPPLSKKFSFETAAKVHSVSISTPNSVSVRVRKSNFFNEIKLGQKRFKEYGAPEFQTNFER